MNRFTDKHFDKLTEIIHDRYGLKYGRQKREFITLRAEKMLKKYEFEDYDRMLFELQHGRDNQMLQDFINLITINKTDFFREKAHFEYLLKNFTQIIRNNPAISESGEFRVWSAACSSGEEPYTLAMVLNEAYGSQLSIKILATDVDSEMIRQAQKAEYNLLCLQNVPKHYGLKYFKQDGAVCTVNEEIKELVTFRLFNLMDSFPFRKKFDLILCRNVMIYFDRETQAEILTKMYYCLNPGGLLFTGHSEALPNKALRFKYIQPAIYMKY